MLWLQRQRRVWMARCSRPQRRRRPEATAMAMTTAFQDVFRLVLVLLGVAYALTCTSPSRPRREGFRARALALALANRAH